MEPLNNPDNGKLIEICCNGPYIVTGNVPLILKTQVVSEYGEPLSWKKEGEIKADVACLLCRCGRSSCRPFCDGTHAKIEFDGADTAPSNLTAERREAYPGCTNITIRNDASLCSLSGFCANRVTSIGEMAKHTEDTQVRAMAIAMIEHCPSGALTYTIEDGDDDIEVDLPQQIAATKEVTSDGVIWGPLWVTGGISILRTDGLPLERRNRVTICSCGRSKSKPLCDGTHREEHLGG